MGCSEHPQTKVHKKKTLFPFVFRFIFYFHFIKLGFNWILLFELTWKFCVSIQHAFGIKLARNACLTKKQCEWPELFCNNFASSMTWQQIPIKLLVFSRLFESITMANTDNFISIVWFWAHSELVLFVSITICVQFREIQFMMWKIEHI